MGLKERQEREREATSRAILDAARDLFVAEGYNSVSIRKIAEKIEYSPAAIYSYFGSKDDIFLALAEEGFRMLLSSAECAAQVDAAERPIDCLRSAFLSVYDFSKSHPEYHALMFLDRSVPKISQHWERFGFVRDIRIQLAGLIQRAVDHGDFPKGSNPEVIFRVLMVTAQGAAAMRLCERVVPGDDVDQIARVAIEAALTGLRTGFPHSYNPDACM